MKITNETAAKKLKEYDSEKLFSVTFIKRTTGETREMLCRKGVGKFVKGTSELDQEQIQHDNNILHVFDVNLYNENCRNMEKALGRPLFQAEQTEVGQKCYRSINLDAIISIKMDGKVYQVNDFPIKKFTFKWTSAGSDLKRIIKARTDLEAREVFKRETGLKRLPAGLLIAKA